MDQCSVGCSGDGPPALHVPRGRILHTGQSEGVQSPAGLSSCPLEMSPTWPQNHG